MDVERREKAMHKETLYHTGLWLGMVFLAASVLTGPVEYARGYQYVYGYSLYGGGEDSHYVETETKLEDGYAVATPSQTGNVTCSANITAWAQDDDSAALDVGAGGLTVLHWIWNGPPGTAPGGTLSWDQTGSGRAEAYGLNTVPNGTHAENDCEAYSGVEGESSSKESWATGNAWGSVQDYDWPDEYGFLAEQWPEESSGTLYKQVADEGKYWYGGVWDSYYYPDDETIPSGTGTVTLFSYAGCSCEGQADAWPDGGSGSEALAIALSNATVDVIRIQKISRAPVKMG
jgi:hypothetical protein